MGVDLTLVPLIGPNFWASHEMIQVERRRELWREIDELEQIDIPEPLACFFAQGKEDLEYGMRVESPYGERLKFTTATQLMTLSKHEAVQDNWRNRAVWAFLAKMPSDWPIVLYWH